MQGEFTIYPQKIKRAAAEYPAMYQALVEAAERLANIENSLDDSSYGDIKNTINQIRENVIRESKSMKQMGDILTECLSEYQSTEKRIASTIITSYSQTTVTDSPDALPPDSDQNYLNDLLKILLKYTNSAGSLSAAAVPF